jgi:FKBP-type peptidyl-prolyl cis-trans isomerase
MLLVGIAPAQDTNTATPSSKPAQSTSSQSKTTPAKKPASSAAKPSTAVALTTQKEKNSYAVGMSIGLGFQKQGIDKSIDSALVIRGMRDALAGSKTAMTEDEMKSTLQAFSTQLTTEAAAANRKESEAFLAANKSKDGVKVLPSGLQYKVLTEGSGPKPAATDTVTVNYRGTLLNGTEFDSSYKRGQPATFGVDHVIKGWTEALQLMPVGSKWQLFIPADLAYRDAPPPRSGIAPGDMLIFEVELLSIGEQKNEQKKQ